MSYDKSTQAVAVLQRHDITNAQEISYVPLHGGSQEFREELIMNSGYEEKQGGKVILDYKTVNILLGVVPLFHFKVKKKSLKVSEHGSNTMKAKFKDNLCLILFYKDLSRKLGRQSHEFFPLKFSFISISKTWSYIVNTVF